jgi:hypothetical protein
MGTGQTVLDHTCFILAFVLQTLTHNADGTCAAGGKSEFKLNVGKLKITLMQVAQI